MDNQFINFFEIKLMKTKYYLLIFLAILLFKNYRIEAQTIQAKYLDKLDFWQIESYNKKVKEIDIEEVEYTDERNINQVLNIKYQIKSKLLFNKQGKIISQFDYKIFHNWQKKQKTYRQTVYEYDEKFNLIKEKIYSNLDTLTFKPKDTSVYSSKIYNYAENGLLISFKEVNITQILVKSTSVITDTINKTIEFTERGNSNDNALFTKIVNKFDDALNLINQSYYKGNVVRGTNDISYNLKGQKTEKFYRANDSYYEQREIYTYNKQNLIDSFSRNTNLDPGLKESHIYTFDKNKNWLTKDIKNQNQKIIHSFKRKISYYK